MRLDIIVPHYREPWEVCKYLFDSIALQRGFSMNNLKVIVVNDGDCLLDEEKFKNYPYQIEYLVKEHGGVSAARNYGLDHSDADYVMFCDIDDGFLSNYGLHLVFSAMQEGFDYLVSNFVEETYSANSTMTIVRHDKDLTFMHGKAYRRQFLVDHDLRFDPAMTLHEDGYFNMLVFSVATNEGKSRQIETPFYLWRWNDNSVVRTNKENFVLRTYDSVMQTRIGLCDQLKKRGYEKELRTAVAMTFLNSYYDFQKPSWNMDKNKKDVQKAEREFRKFYVRFKSIFFDMTNKEISEIAIAARQNALNNGFLMEGETLKEFLKRVGENESSGLLRLQGNLQGHGVGGKVAPLQLGRR